MDPPPLNPLLPTQTTEMAEISTFNESVNTTVDQTNLAENTLVDQHQRRVWTNKPEGEQVDHTRDEQGFEKFEDYFSDTDVDESLVKPSSAPTSVIQSSVTVPTPSALEESILEPVLEEVTVETPPVILNPGNLEESLPGPVQDSVTGGPGEHPATPPLDAITEASTEDTAVILEPVEDPVETIAEQVVQEAEAGQTDAVAEALAEVREAQESAEREEVVEEPFVEEKAAVLTSLQQPTEQLPAELLAEEEEQTGAEVTAVESLETENKEESIEEEAPLTKPEQYLLTKPAAAEESNSSPRRPPNKEEASKAVAEALAEVKEATESAGNNEKRDKIKADKISAEKARAEKREAEKLKAEKLLADKVATTPKKSAAELSADWSDEEEAKEPTATPGGTMSDKPKRQRKIPAKLMDAAVEETPKAHKTPKNKKLDLEKGDSGKKSHKKKVNTEEVEESLESIASEMAKPLEKSKAKKESPKKTPKKGAAVKPKEDWMTLIFGEDGEKITKNGKKVGEKKDDSSIALEENEAEEFISKGTPFFTKGKEPKSDSKRGRPRKQDLEAKSDAVTKIGNNMYFYTGPGGSGSPPPLVDKEEDSGDEMEVDQPAAAVASPSKDDKRSRTKRCNECDGCTREDCGNCEMCKDRPKFGGQNKKKQACLMRQCLFNNPVAKTVFDAGEGEEDPEISLNIPSPEPSRGRRGSKAGSTITSTPAVGRSGSNRSSVDSRASTARTRSATPPRDEDLPDFDPNKFTPGYVPKTVKKGEDEYVIVVSGVADTGLCGNYWGDLNNLPSRRRSGAPTPKTTPKPAPKKATPAVEIKKAATPPPKKSHKKQPPPEKSASPAPAAKSHKKKGETPPPAEASGRGRKRKVEENAEETQALEPEKGKKRKADAEEDDTKGKKRKSEPEDTKPDVETKPEAEKEEGITTTYSDFDSPETSQPLRTTKRPSSNKKEEAAGSSPDKQDSPLTARAAASVSSALAHGTPAGQQRSVSCVADTSTQREVVVECFAPYDDHRWVNIGKERDGMAPDAVQYARALRPPYHLLSFLRIKGHSTKGMSCTDKNTMVFVCLEGEITVILHTTQFNAKKGDSFYIPPKNYYNLINQKAREAELSLVQFQYDGPLPTVQPQ